MYTATDSPVERILSHLKNVKQLRNDEWIASCPVPSHGRRRGDVNPSLSVGVGRDGRVLLHCHAGCETAQVLESLGLRMSDLFPRRDGTPEPGRRKGKTSSGSKANAPKGRKSKGDEDIPNTVTIATLAKAKGLPVEYVGQFCEQISVGKIRIVYRLPDGSRAPRHRIRRGTPERKKVRWEGGRSGPKPVPYGLDRLADARKAGYLILVEGETDTWTLWYHNFPALGLPGASMYRKLLPEYLEGIERLYLWREPDSGGDRMIRGVAQRLAEIGWRGQAYVVQIDGIKDPNELHLRDPNTFRQTLLEAMERAEPLDLSTDRSRGPQPDEPQPDEPQEVPLQTVREALPDAPGPADLRIPPNFVLKREGIYTIRVHPKYGPQIEEICPTPVIIVGRLVDQIGREEDTEYLRLAWRRPDGWRTMVTERGIALDGRRLVALASKGFPVASRVAGELARYLLYFDEINRDTIPCSRVSSHLGWLGQNGEYGFLWGRVLITADGDMVALSTDDAAAIADPRRDNDLTSFRPITPGDAQIAAGFRRAGTLAGWIQAVAPLADYPRALLAIYASCVPPLLPIVDAPNFAVDWSSRTSTGKTTVLRVAASVWGCPDERSEASAMGTWDATRVWVERASAVLYNLPLILDDTKRARSPETVAQVVYGIESGRGRGRGNTQSTAQTGSWRTVLLSSGEARATSYTEDGGTRARVIEIVGMPFGRDDHDTGLLVDRLNAGVMTHYGHAGPELVRWLLRHREQWPELRQQYQTTVERYAGHHSAVARRLAHAAAAITIAAACLHAALQEAGYPLPWDFRDPFECLWDDIARAAEEAPPEVRALQDIKSWAHAHEESFWGRHGAHARAPSAGWAGRWDPGKDWRYIAYYPVVLRRVLRELGYEPDAILEAWRGKRWLDVTEDKRSRYTKQMRIGPHGERAHLVVIRREAFEEVEGRDSDAGGDKVVTEVVTGSRPKNLVVTRVS